MNRSVIVALSVVSVGAVALSISSRGVLGARENGSASAASNQQTVTPSQQQGKITNTPSGTQVQNQVGTQNKGEESQLKVTTQEQSQNQEATGELTQEREQKMLQTMTKATESVEALSQLKTVGVVKDEILQVATQQSISQSRVKIEVQNLEERNDFLKLLIGTDYSAVKSIRQEMEQNQFRVKNLERIQTQLTNQGDIVLVQEMVKSLVEQNTSLQEQVEAEESSVSLLGWLFKWFAQ